MLTNRYRQRFAGGVHAGDGTLRADSALGEHCSLALELPLLVQIFQRAQQIIRGILLKQPPVFAVVQQAVLCGKGIVGGVQTLLCCLDILVRVVVQLLVDQVVDDLPQLHHASDTPLGGVGQLHLRHHGIFPVEHLTVHYGVGEVLHLWVGRQSAPGGFFFSNVRSIHLGGGVLPLDMLHRFGKLVCQHCTLNGCNGEFLPSVLGAFCGQFAQNHLRVAYEILVDGKAVLGLAKLHPVWLMVDRTVTLLQKNNVRNNIGTSIGAESVVGQTDGTQQIGSLCNVLAGSAVLAVHGVAAGNERHDAARTHLVDGLGEKVVVNRKSQLVVRLVVDFILTERHIAHRQIVEITAVGSLKTGNGNVCLRIQFFRNTPGDAVQFHAVQAAVLHGVWPHSEEVAHAHTRFQNVTAAEAHALHGIVDTTDNSGAGVVGVQD